MVTIFIDGSSTRIKHNNYVISWGMIVSHDGNKSEHYGSNVSNNKMVAGNHELLAFIEGYLWLKSHNFKNHEISFYSDDESVSYGGYWLTDSSHYSRSESLVRRLKLVRDNFYPYVNFEELLDCLKESRFSKVKGHAKCVNNLRVDYLAKFARDMYLGTGKILKSFDEWLNDGFLTYDRSGISKWYPHFIKTV